MRSRRHGRGRGSSPARRRVTKVDRQGFAAGDCSRVTASASRWLSSGLRSARSRCPTSSLRDSPDRDELRARNPWRSISATPGDGWRLLLGDSASDELLGTAEIRTPAFRRSARLRGTVRPVAATSMPAGGVVRMLPRGRARTAEQGSGHRIGQSLHTQSLVRSGCGRPCRGVLGSAHCETVKARAEIPLGHQRQDSNGRHGLGASTHAYSDSAGTLAFSMSELHRGRGGGSAAARSPGEHESVGGDGGGAPRRQRVRAATWVLCYMMWLISRNLPASRP
jgi:hypothetical protein